MSGSPLSFIERLQSLQAQAEMSEFFLRVSVHSACVRKGVRLSPVSFLPFFDIFDGDEAMQLRAGDIAELAI